MLQGWDKKAIEKLEKLKNYESLRGGDTDIVNGMWARYQTEQTHFFTNPQRKLIKDIYRRYFDSAGNPLVSCKDIWPTAQKQVFKEFCACLDNNMVPKREVEFANILRDWGNTTDSDHITSGRLEIMKRIIKSTKNVGHQKKLYEALKEKFETGNILSGNPGFSEIMLTEFEAKGSWTETQQEHIEKILVDNLDPGESKLPGPPELEEIKP